MDQDLPTIPHELLEALQERFPLTNPTPTVCERELWIEVGRQQLIEFLSRHYLSQQENILTNHVPR